MGLAPDTWGPCLWNAIHTLCIGAPDVIPQMIQVQYSTYFNAMPYVLPCSKCTKHLLEIYQKYPIEQYVGDKKTLFKWSVLVHNEVNISTGKKPMDVETAFTYWENKLKEGKKENFNQNKYNYVWWVLLITIILVIFTVYHYLRRVKK